ncbi:MAG: carbonic anhydrase family protein [Hyphomicrobium sp.]
MLISRLAASAIALATLAVTAFAETGHPHWTYTGNEGPEHWGALSKDFAACNGNQQSPVNITKAHKAENGALALKWTPFAPKVLNNGHTIQAAAVPGNVTTFAGKDYALQQVHFHHLSEHAIDGKHAPMEAHFVSQDKDGKLLVLGVLIDEGTANSEIAKLWEVAPQSPGEAMATETIDFAKLVPTASKFYRYSGSLTTPPCSEIVDWVLFADPITASKEQIEAFAKLYPANNRPVQALHDRTIVLGR